MELLLLETLGVTLGSLKHGQHAWLWSYLFFRRLFAVLGVGSSVQTNPKAISHIFISGCLSK